MNLSGGPVAEMAALKFKVELYESGTDTSQADPESW